MFSKNTADIRVTVVPEYDYKNSFPAENRFVFKYHISIENASPYRIKILQRRWLIFDTGFGFSEAAGNGIIGLTPELEPNARFTYFSNVMLHSGVGNMQGIYLVKNTITDENFEIEIPKFQLLAEVLCN